MRDWFRMSTKCKYMCIYHIHKLTRVYHIKKVNTHVYYTKQVFTQSFQYLLSQLGFSLQL